MYSSSFLLNMSFLTFCQIKFLQQTKFLYKILRFINLSLLIRFSQKSVVFKLMNVGGWAFGQTGGHQHSIFRA